MYIVLKKLCLTKKWKKTNLLQIHSHRYQHWIDIRFDGMPWVPIYIRKIFITRLR